MHTRILIKFVQITNLLFKNDMIGEHYELNPRNRKRLFYFISKGKQGEITEKLKNEK